MNSLRHHAAVVLVTLLGSMSAQIRQVGTAQVGGSIAIDVASNAQSIDVVSPNGERTHHTVPPGKRVTIPVTWPAGSVVVIEVGWGASRQRVTIEILAP